MHLTSLLEIAADALGDRTAVGPHDGGLTYEALLARARATSRDLGEEQGEQLAAVAAGLVSLLAGAARLLESEPVRSNLTELGDGFLFSMAVSDGASLLVYAERECDIGQVTYAMAELINQVGDSLTPTARARMLSESNLPGAR